MILGAVLTFILLALVMKAELDRDVNQKVMDELGNYLLPKKVKGKFERNNITGLYIHTSAPKTPWKGFSSGRLILRIYLTGFIVIDITLSALFR